jgi:hypothetical protein
LARIATARRCCALSERDACHAAPAPPLLLLLRCARRIRGAGAQCAAAAAGAARCGADAAAEEAALLNIIFLPLAGPLLAKGR